MIRFVKSWNHNSLVTGDLVKEVEALKKQSGRDMMVYGGA